MTQNEIWTIGHSTHTFEEFAEMLKGFSIQHLVDVRNFPGSKRFPHFNKEALEISLRKTGINYTHIKELGGRRKAKVNSINTAWRNDAFRGYADYMESDEFKSAVHELEELAKKERVAYMCSEAVWWRCHRSLISDYLKAKGWIVHHIMSKTKSDIHPYTKPAHIKNGKLSYTESDLFTE
jgi:uncharacterized protein (DUF488 family)